LIGKVFGIFKVSFILSDFQASGASLIEFVMLAIIMLASRMKLPLMLLIRSLMSAMMMAKRLLENRSRADDDEVMQRTKQQKQRAMS